MTKNYTASTVLNYSCRKSRLIIDTIRGKNVAQAINTLATCGRPKAKKIYHLLKSAMSNMQVPESSYQYFLVDKIVAEQAQVLKRYVPRSRGSAYPILRRYSRIKVWVSSLIKENVAETDSESSAS
jgi:large subunit ribosomal protein L22